MALHGRRGLRSASRSKNTSARVNSATYGTHVTSSALSGGSQRHARGIAQEGNLASSTRRRKAAKRGTVDYLRPQTASGETNDAYSRRMGRRGYTEDIQHKSRMKSVILVLIVALLVVGVGGFAAQFAFFSSVDSKLAPKDSRVASVLTQAKEGEPYYAVLMADLNETDGSDGIDALMLARVDKANKAATLIMLPANARILAGDSYTTAQALASSDGDSAVISYVSQLAGVSIAHYLRIDETGFERLVDSLGGIYVEVTEEVDDPTAGSTYLAVGGQLLNGAAAATYLRASNYYEGADARLRYQRVFTVAFADRFFAADGFKPGFDLDEWASHISCDWDGRSALKELEALRGITADDIFTTQATGYEATSTAHGLTLRGYVIDTQDFAKKMGLVALGEDPATLEQVSVVDVDKESFDILVRNGSGVTGGATAIATILEDAGFQIADKGNADSFVYNETLIIYLDPEKEPAAQAVKQALGTGRVLNGANYYTFDADVMVVLGADWKPLS